LEGKYPEDFDELLRYSFLQYQYWVGVCIFINLYGLIFIEIEVKKPIKEVKKLKKKKKRKFDLTQPLYQQKSRSIIKREEFKEKTEKHEKIVKLVKA